MTDLTREQIEEARDAILDSINATEQEFACNKAQHDLLGVRRREFLNDLCDMALRADQAEAKNTALNKAIENLKECLDQAEARAEALRVLLAESQEGIGGDWRQRRDELLEREVKP
ncbi:MAG: hypothetical protein EB015_21255 [Methylocystaceae bacterium]|nr:hypothetical protein [Methylocystaceae bacterium]